MMLLLSSAEELAHVPVSDDTCNSFGEPKAIVTGPSVILLNVKNPGKGDLA